MYSSEEAPGLLTHLQHISDIEIKAAPLNTGLAADVHGQVSTNSCFILTVSKI